MSQTLPGTPNTDYDFGQEFDYSLWIPGTTIDLVNVNWNNDYRDVVRFDKQSDLDTYIDSLNGAGIRVTQLSYVKPNQPVRLNIPHNRVNKYNYLRASNPLQPVEDDLQKNYYYFILDSKYVAPNTTELTLQLDVWQTYVYNVEFGRCYVERGHIGIANEKDFTNFGRDYLTVPEGLDIGAEYRHVWYAGRQIVNVAAYDVLVVSTVDLTVSGGDVSNPVLRSATGSLFQSLPSGANMYIFNGTNGFLQFMRETSDKPWVTQGIINISIIPKITRYHSGFAYPPIITGGGSAAPTGAPARIDHTMMTMWRNNQIFKNAIGTRYAHLKKFLTFPYMAIELTTYTGNVTILRPEAWNNPHAQVRELVSLFPPNQRIVFTPIGYNANEEMYDSDSQEISDMINVQTMMGNFPSIPIVNDGAINYMAANKNMLAFGRQSADWSQQRAMGMASGQYDIASGAMNTMAALSGIGIGADIAQTGNTNRTQAAQAIWSGVGNIAQGAGMGAFGGAGLAAAGAIGGASQGVVNGVNTAIGIAANDEALAIRNSAAMASLGANVGQTGLVRDTNKQLADWAAKGDYATTIAGINAKIQDAQLIQPSTSGGFGGEAFNFINFFGNMHVKWKMIDNAAIKVIGEYWLRYGYAIRASIVPPKNLQVMTKFSYWKVTETYISSATTPESFKQVIRGILEKGVTVWKNPSDIGVIDWADNKPLPGINY